jgi:hypothetical protein
LTTSVGYKGSRHGATAGGRRVVRQRVASQWRGTRVSSGECTEAAWHQPMGLACITSRRSTVPTTHGFGAVVLPVPQRARARTTAKANVAWRGVTSRMARAQGPKYFKFPCLTQSFSKFLNRTALSDKYESCRSSIPLQLL